MIRSVPATRADFRAFQGELPERTVTARALREGDEVLGVAGYYMVMRPRPFAVVFSAMKPGRIKPMTIWREALHFMSKITFPAICYAEQNSGPFLERMGWQKTDLVVEGHRVYLWQV